MANPLTTRGALVLAFALVVPWVSLHAGKAQKNLKKAPEWIAALPEIALPATGSDDNLYCIQDSMTLEIDEKGEMVSITRYAIKILKAEGFDDAIAYASYSSDTDKVKSFEAWVAHPNGDAISYGKQDVVDRSAKANWQIASSARYQYLDARRDVKVGSIFAYEKTVVESSIFAQQRWYFQGEHPRRESSISVKVPAGWRVEPLFFNMEPLAPTEGDGFQTWKLAGLPGLKRQELAPQSSELMKWATFSLFPPADATLKRPLHLYRSWQDLAADMTRSYEPQRIASTEIARKVQELVAGRSGSWERTKALAAYARSVNYVSESLNLGKGAGFVPRQAGEIFSTNWGDCKDKATLLCSMLNEAGVEAFPLIVNAEDRDTIYEQWPTGSQFNHCIIAIAVDDTVESDMVVEHPQHGRLLIFDPTSELTAIGDLPDLLQGSKGILLSGSTGGLIDLPVADRENSVLERRIQAELFDNGSLVAKLSERSTGQIGRKERGTFRGQKSVSEYQKLLQGWIGEYAPAARLTSPEVNDNLDTGEFEVKLDFASAGYGKSLGGSLITFKPVLIDRRRGLGFATKETRTQPLILDGYHLDEVTEIFIPPGFGASELPAALSLETAFGFYRGSVELVEDKVVLKRAYWLNKDPIPAEGFAEAKTFFEKVISFEQAPVVLERR